MATASTREELLEEIREAIEFHVEGMCEDGEPIPEPQTAAAVVGRHSHSGEVRTNFLIRCINTLESAFEQLRQREPGDTFYEIFRCRFGPGVRNRA